jgi:hypothetical protein
MFNDDRQTIRTAAELMLTNGIVGETPISTSDG